MCSVNPYFPLRLCMHFMQQSNMTFNMIRAARMNPKLSAYELLEGYFDFNSSSLVPPRRKVIIQKKTLQHKSWAPYVNQAWYIGQTPKHYQ